jgi:uncharacterized protein (TIGR03437 family)
MRPFFNSLTSFALLLVAGAVLARAQTPAIATGGVLNAASSDKTGLPIALGSLVSIYGTNLSPQTDQATNIPLPSTLDGVTVTVNGVLAPILVISSGQINAQIPWDAVASAPPTTSTTAEVVVATKSGGASVPANVTVGPAGPGIFTFSYGSGQAVAYSATDGAVASATPIPPYANHPFAIGDVLVILATGLGAVNPPVASGAAPSGLSNTVTIPTVLVGNIPGGVLFSGLSQYPGVYQLNVVLAANTPPGNAVSLQIQMDGVTSRSDVTIAVAQ